MNDRPESRGRAQHHLVVLAHPNPQSYTASLAGVYCDALRAQGHTVDLRDLYRHPIAGALGHDEYEASQRGEYGDDVVAEHGALRAADGLTLVFPLWWMGPPAILKGWIDRVLSYGVAYTMKGEDPVPLLEGKGAATVVTMGTPLATYQTDHSLEHMASLWNRHIFGFCGLHPVGNVWLGNSSLATDDEREAHRAQCRALAERWTQAAFR